MALPVYTKRFFIGTVPTSWGAIFTFTGPAGAIRDIQIHNNAASSGRVSISLSDQAGSAAFLIDELSFPATSMLHWSGRVAVLPGDTVSANAYGGSVYAVITGYQFLE